MFTEKDISDLSTDFSGRTQANGKIHLGMCRTKRMRVLIHWVQDFYCISRDPNIVDMNEVMFIKHLDTALYMAYIRNKIIELSNTKDKEYSPGPLDRINNELILAKGFT